MNRTIKFRAWNSRTGKMVDLQAITPLAMDSDLVKLGAKGLFIPFDEHMILMQYIGFNDPTGKEIFEGDVVVGGLDDRDYVRSVVRVGASETSVDTYESSFTVPYYGVYLEGSIGLEEDLMAGKQYVIGNVYENSDLLEGKQ
jgi:uncharacterized phage protein (TIGR01671 family)